MAPSHGSSSDAKWLPVSDDCNFGVAIANFKQEDCHPHRLPLLVGDTVIIFQRCQDWFYGCLFRDSSKQGIFPVKFVAIKNSTRDRQSLSSCDDVRKELPIIQEVPMILREWVSLAKQLYITRNERFEPIRLMIYELLSYRSQVIKNPPLNQLDEINQLIAAKIDQGNALLGLDLIVRDECGNQMNPEVTSTIELFRAHEFAMKRIKLSMSRGGGGGDSSSRGGGDRNSGTGNSSKAPNYIYNLFISIRNFVCRIGDDADLIVSLFDGKEMKFISENYLVKWDRDGLVKNLDLLDKLNVIFTDLGSKDMLRERVFLICQVIRIGGMDQRESGETMQRGKSMHSSKKFSDGIRRPFGVVAMDITEVITEKTMYDLDHQFQVPFLPCEEKDSIELIVKKFVNKMGDTLSAKLKDQGLWISMKMLHGNVKQLIDENVVAESTPIARKMAFPEVINPGDVRNDLYLTLNSADFSSKTSNVKNIEVTVRVCDESGRSINNVLTIGAGCEMLSEYKSVVYYHEEKPKWMETLCIKLPIEDFYDSHLKFLFKHRSSNESKDKNEKPFALSFLRLKNENETAIIDRLHDLLVYRIGSKKFYESDSSYLELPSTREQLNQRISESDESSNLSSNPKLVVAHYSIAGLNLAVKDSFHVSTVICSTKLTQNVHLLALLMMNAAESSDEEICSCLTSILRVDSEEIFKFLQDTLDALFKIFIEKESHEICQLFFQLLIRIIGLISDPRYQNFRPDIDSYIEENFSWTLAYSKLVSVLHKHLENYLNYATSGVIYRGGSLRQSVPLNISDFDPFLTLNVMQSLEYLFRFIVRSRILYATLEGGRGKMLFEVSLKHLFDSFTKLMALDGPEVIKVQAKCLKYFPATIPHLMTVYDGPSLSLFMTDLINAIPLHKLKQQKISCISDIIHTDCLFKKSECRKYLLPSINDHIRIMIERKEHFAECINILGEILKVLHGKDVGPVKDDISDLVLSILRTVIKIVVETSRDDEMIGHLVSILLAILRQMSGDHYVLYFDNFKSSNELNVFLNELLMVFKDLLSNPVFPPDSIQMILHQNHVVLNAMKHLSKFIRDRFSSPFEQQLWSNYFHCSISFLTQASLQVENFSNSKRNRILNQYKDMRHEMAIEVRSMWFSLSGNKILFVPSMVGPFLEMTLIPDTQLRRETLPIFFDMIQCEFFEPVPSHGRSEGSASNGSLSHGRSEGLTSNGSIRGTFTKMESEVITQLDKLVEGGKGDKEFTDLFKEVIGGLCESHQLLFDTGCKFVSVVVSLMKRLLEYREVMSSSGDANRDNSMLCIVSILDFYNQIKRQELYIRYLYKLVNFHVQCDNFVEAGHTLLHHARLLKWSDETLSGNLRCAAYPDILIHRQLKEKLYLDIINYFDSGKLWEDGLRLCKELVHQYEYETFDYLQLSNLHEKMSKFYAQIMQPVRPEPEYFRVGYFGQGFHSSIRNKNYVYRGKEYERHSEFQGRLLNRYPDAQLLVSLSEPTEDVKCSEGQFILINKVDPIMNEREEFRGKEISEPILKYYRVNEVQQFSFSRRVRKSSSSSLPKESDNEFAFLWIERTVLETTYPLPGILRLFAVENVQFVELSPIQNAIETMESTNNDLKKLLIECYRNPSAPLNNLSMKLNGIIEAAVNGGIANYEKAFFTDSYLREHFSTRDRAFVATLKDLIAVQVSILGPGIAIHRDRVPPDMRPFHEHLESQFEKMRSTLQDKYGRRTLPKDLAEARNFRNTIIQKDSLKPNEPVRGSSPNSTLPSRKSPGTKWKSPLDTISRIRLMSKVENQETLRKSKEDRSKWYTYDRDDTNEDICIITHPSSSLSFIQHFELNQHRASNRSETDSRRFSHDRPSSGSHSSPNRSQVTSTISTTSGISTASGISTTSGDTINNDNIDTDFDEEASNPPPIPVKSHVTSASDLTSNGYSSTKRKTSTSASKKPLPPLPTDDYPLIPPRSDSVSKSDPSSTIPNTLIQDSSSTFPLTPPQDSSSTFPPTPPQVPARKRPPEILPRRSLNQREKSTSSMNSEL